MVEHELPKLGVAGSIPVYRSEGALVKFRVELEQETDGRWIAEVMKLPGVMTYGESRLQALAAAEALALRVIADRLEHGETSPDEMHVSFIAA